MSDKLHKAFNDGRAFERQFTDWKFKAVVGEDEKETLGTIIDGIPTAVSRKEIRNELRQELRQSWKTAKFKGKLSPRLKSVLKPKSNKKG